MKGFPGCVWRWDTSAVMLCGQLAYTATRELAVVLAVTFVLQWQLTSTWGQPGTDTHVFYAVEMEGGSGAARTLAELHGLQFISQMGNLEDHYTLKDPQGGVSGETLESQLLARPGVKWVKRQKAHYRDKRASVQQLNTQEFGDWHMHREIYDIINSEDGLADALSFNDPYWGWQWELFNRGQFGSPKRFDLNIMPVWIRNITGRDVVVSIVDDGIDHTNADLKKNFEAFASFDLRGTHGLSHDPMPHKDAENGHGTRCAGEIAMEANNSYCGVGIAFNARIGGIRLLDGAVTDSMEATALSYNNDYIDIYTCCWGPKDNGAEIGGPGRLTEKALRLGAQKGRGGKGNIFVWASGNGGVAGDHCGADGYISSIYTVAIGALAHTGVPATYSEACPGVMAVTLTGAGTTDSLPLVTASNLDQGCVTDFTGTSSAAPIAAGLLALVLEANPDLTWRDVQHLIVNTAKIPIPQEPGWSINGAGYHTHDRYGFGLLDAGLMVQQALLFKTVPPHRKCSQEVTLDPVSWTSNAVNTLEHVQVTVSVTSVCRGDLSVDLISPYGTRSRLLGTRRNDNSPAGLRNWTMMTLQSWGEDPRGTWRLQVTDNKGTVYRCSRGKFEKASGTVLKAVLHLYGTFDPQKELRGKPHPSVLDAWKDGQAWLDTQTVIQKKFEIENHNKINANDIPPLPVRKSSKLMSPPAKWFKSQDMDDTNGLGFKTRLKGLWNTLRGNAGLLDNTRKTKQSAQLRWADSQQLLGAMTTSAEHQKISSLDGVTAPASGYKTQLVHTIGSDIRKMENFQNMVNRVRERQVRGQLGRSQGTRE